VNKEKKKVQDRLAREKKTNVAKQNADGEEDDNLDFAKFAKKKA
jgi:hypothetical protein